MYVIYTHMLFMHISYVKNVIAQQFMHISYVKNVIAHVIYAYVIYAYILCEN